MFPKEGRYQHERSDNMDEYFKAVGVPYMARMMMSMTNPTLEVTCTDGRWTIKSLTLFRTHEQTFVPGEPYDEEMPGGSVLKNVATVEEDKIIVTSTPPSGSTVTREYEFSDEGITLIMTHQETGIVAKRYFSRIHEIN